MHVVLGGSSIPPESTDYGDEVTLIQSLPEQVIFFSNVDFKDVDPNHNEALVVSLDIADNKVKKVLVDNGS